MTGTTTTQGTWDAIAREKRIDKLVRAVCTAAWAVTFVITAGYAYIVWQQVAFMRDALGVGAVTRQAMLASATPLLLALGALDAAGRRPQHRRRLPPLPRRDAERDPAAAGRAGDDAGRQRVNGER